MAITFVGSTVATVLTSQADLDIDMPGSSPGDDIAADDLAIIITNWDRNNASYTFVPTGFTESVFHRFDDSSDGANMNTGVYYKILTGSETTVSIDYDPESLDYNGGALCLVFRGADTTTQFDVAVTKVGDADQGNDSSPASPAITPTTDNGALVLVHIPEGGTTQYTAYGAPSTPSGMGTPIATRTATGVDNVDPRDIIASYKLDYGTAATITPTDWTHTWNGSNFRGFRNYSIAIRPDAGGASVAPLAGRHLQNLMGT